MTGIKKQRLDNILTQRHLASSVRHARALIMAGQIIVDDRVIDKPGTLIAPAAAVRIKNPQPAYVGRGGVKLEKPLAVFQVPVANAVVLDVGASTGGFTDCLLQHGAGLVFAVDVGYGQLAWKLQQDPRVVRRDRINVRDLSPADLLPRPVLAVIDASFTSLQKLLPHVAKLISPDGALLFLVKPQFEVQRQAVEPGGLVKDPKQYQLVLQRMVETAGDLKLRVIGILESPLPGRKGNREFFMYARKISCSG